MLAGPSVGPALSARLPLTAHGQPIPVVVTLADQVDPAAFAGHPAALIHALRQRAEVTQRTLAPILRGRGRSFWIANAVALRATPAELAALAANPAVAQVEVDKPLALLAAAGRSPGGEGWGVDAIRAPAVWRSWGLTGRGVVVGSIDTGVDPLRPPLNGKVVGWHDFVGGRADMYDDNGHGTATILTMVGGEPTPGVAPGARVLVAKAFDASGHASHNTVLAAAQWMADPDGSPASADQPAVIDGSWSSVGANDVWMRQVVRVWQALGIVAVFAAGNSGPGPASIESPSSYPESLAVGALADDRRLAGYSSRGPVVWQDPDATGPPAGTVLTKPDLVAPGQEATSPGDPAGEASRFGSSIAAPHVVGVVALMRQADPHLVPERARAILRQTATDLGPAGPDQEYGAGRIDALGALAAVLGVPRPSLVDSGRRPRLAAIVARTTLAAPARSLVVRGQLRDGPAVIRAELRSIAKSQLGRGAAVALLAARSGRFRLLLRLHTPPPGRYRLVVSALRATRAVGGSAVRREVRILRHPPRRGVRR